MNNNNRGFTLVELMVTISIIGILSSVAIPQYNNAMYKARCAEVPVNLSKISNAQDFYFSEAHKYKNSCTWGQGNDIAGKNLGVSIDITRYWVYSSYVTNSGAGYNASAKLVSNIGDAKITSTPLVRRNELDVREVAAGDATSIAALKKYLGSWINN